MCIHTHNVTWNFSANTLYIRCCLRIAARPANVPRKVYDSRARPLGLVICCSIRKKSLTQGQRQGQQTCQVFVHTVYTHLVFLLWAAGAHDHDHNSHGHNAEPFSWCIMRQPSAPSLPLMPLLVGHRLRSHV